MKSIPIGDGCIFYLEIIYNRRKVLELGITNDDLEELGAESYEQVDNILKDIFTSGLSVSPYVNINRVKSQDSIEIKTICGTTIDGILCLSLIVVIDSLCLNV